MVDFVQENMFDNFICNCGEYTAKANMFECATCQVKNFFVKFRRKFFLAKGVRQVHVDGAFWARHSASKLAN